MIRILLLLLLAIHAPLASAEPNRQQRSYEYLLYLRQGPARDVVAEASAKVPAKLSSHRLVSPAALRAWDGRGKIPLALEMRNVSGKVLDEQEIFDTAEPLRNVLGAKSPQPATALAVMIGIPQGLNVAAYAEALRLAAEIAKGVRSPAFQDSETLELYRIENLIERLTAGQGGAGMMVSASNPPGFTIMGGITDIAFSPEGGYITHGLRKTGVPELYLHDWIPGVSHLWLFETVGGLLLSGQIPAQPGAQFALRKDVHASLRFTKSVNRLELDFPGPATMHLYERQQIFVNKFYPSRYSALGPVKAQQLDLAIARAKAQIKDLRKDYPALVKQGKRIFVSSRMDLLLEKLLNVRGSKDLVQWEEVVSWDGQGQLKLNRWDGDPRAGGSRSRYAHPIRIDGQTYTFIESDMDEGSIEDILVIDRSGKASGGAVSALLSRLVAE